MAHYPRVAGDRVTLTLDCDDDHDYVSWDVTITPAKRCTLRHSYCGGGNPDCNDEDADLIAGEAKCPVCGHDFWDYAAQYAGEYLSDYDDAAREDAAEREAEYRADREAGYRAVRPIGEGER